MISSAPFAASRKIFERMERVASLPTGSGFHDPSYREFTREPIRSSSLLAVLRQAVSPDGGVRGPTASAGALHAVHPFVVTARVDDLRDSVNYVDGATGALVELWARPPGFESLFHEEFVRDAAAVIVLAVDLDAHTAKYGARGYRFAQMEAGMLLERILSAVDDVDLRACVIGGFNDNALCDVLGIDPCWEEPSIAVALGAGEGAQ